MNLLRVPLSGKWFTFALALVLCPVAGVMAAAAQEKGKGPRAEFQVLNPCPSTGKQTGACPGYVVDLVILKCAGGANRSGNMQWVTTAEAGTRKKDLTRREALECPVEPPEAAKAAAPEQWVLLGTGEGEGLNAYYDPASLTRNGNRSKMRTLRDFKEPQASATGPDYLSSRVRREYDCKMKRTRLLHVSRHSGNMGAGITTETASGDKLGPVEWVPVTPDSVGEGFWTIACAQGDTAK